MLIRAYSGSSTMKSSSAAIAFSTRSGHSSASWKAGATAFMRRRSWSSIAPTKHSSLLRKSS